MAVGGWWEVIHQVGQGRADGGVVLGADDDEPERRKAFFVFM